MENETPNSFSGYAIVELFGHQREAGYVTTQTFGQAVLFRIDVPEFPERDVELKEPEYLTIQDGESGFYRKYCPPGTKVRRPAIPARSRLVGPGAIYAISPCTEEAARKAIEASVDRPLVLLELPKAPALTIGKPQTQAEDTDDWEEEIAQEDGEK